jgi:hypothetical protein
MITPPYYTGHFGRNETSLQGTRSSQPFGLSNETTNLWSQLLGDFLSSGQLVLYQAYSGPIIDLSVKNEAD